MSRGPKKSTASVPLTKWRDKMGAQMSASLAGKPGKGFAHDLSHSTSQVSDRRSQLSARLHEVKLREPYTKRTLASIPGPRDKIREDREVNPGK